jgi:hypothetical protein
LAGRKKLSAPANQRRTGQETKDEIQKMCRRLRAGFKGKGIQIPKFELASMSVVYSFTIDEVNMPVGPQLFQDATSK